MKKIDLNIYNNYLIYFQLYDVKINESEMGIEKFLQSVEINPSTYRKCKKGELIAGPKLIKILTDYFDYVMPSNDIIDDFENLCNDIYYKMYYKIYDDYDDYLKKINNLLDQKYTIYPIIMLFKLLLIISSNLDYKVIVENNIKDYNEVKKYSKFFTEDLMDIYELIYLTFEYNISEGYWLKNYNNGSAYFILSTRSYVNKKYIESIFFATKAKEFLSRDGNIIRTLFLNNTLMSSLLFVGNYQECNDLAFKQQLVLKAVNSQYIFLQKNAMKYNVVSLLGLNDYSKILIELDKYNSFNLTLLTCYLVSIYKEKGKKAYINYFNDLQIENLDNEYKEYLNILNIVILQNKKSLLQKLEKFDIEKWIVNILKKIEMKS